VIVPREIFGDGKAEVFGIVDDLKLLAMGIIIRPQLAYPTTQDTN
jgi:hypothetical protein